MNRFVELASRKFSFARNFSKNVRPRRHARSQTVQEGEAQWAQQEVPAASPTSKLLIPVLGYFGVVNVGAFGLFWYDKQQALTGGWRVPEKSLQLSALVGGWIGGMIAMNTFRHKTKKESFRQPYFVCVALNAGISALLLGSIIGKNQAALQKLAPLLNQLASQAKPK